MVPKLEPKTKCVNVPRENCVRMRVNPRLVKRPVIREWCSGPEDEEIVPNGDEGNRVESNDKDFDDDDFAIDPNNIQLIGIIPSQS